MTINSCKRIYLIIYFILTVISLRGQTPLKPSQTFTITDGLAHNGVTSLLEDSKGYIWIGTYDGINKYDGYSMETFKNTSEKEIVASNRIRALAEDKKGNIWIGTDDGISIYNYEHKSFRTIYANKNRKTDISGPIVRGFIFRNEEKQILAYTEDEGVLVFDDQYRLLYQDVPRTLRTGSNPAIYNGVALSREHFIFSTNSGLILYNATHHSFSEVLHKQINYSNAVVNYINKTLFVATRNGVMAVSYKNDKAGKYSFSVTARLLEKYEFKTIALDRNKSLWMGTLNKGIFNIDDIADFKNHKNLSYFNETGGFTRMSVILPTKDKGCWAGTFNKGIYRFRSHKNPFNFYNAQQKLPYGLRTDNSMRITLFNQSEVILQADNSPLALFNTNTHSFRPIPFKLPQEPGLFPSISYIDKSNNLWIKYGPGGYLYAINLKTNQIRKLNNFFYNKSITDIIEDKFGNIWISGTEGVCRLTRNSEGEILALEDINTLPAFKTKKLALVRFLYQDPDHDFIWVGSNSQGLFRINIHNNPALADAKIDNFIYQKNKPGSISSNFVSAIIRLPNHQLWIGTERGGICLVSNSTKTPVFKAFTESQGLSNNVVKSILADKENNLWIATNIGLNKFNIKKQTFRNFSKEDGLPFEDFWYSSAKLPNGDFVFSGVEGMLYFNPQNIINKEAIPRLYFGNLKILNTIILPGDTINGRVLLNRRLRNKDEIQLKHNENVFSIEINSLHFSNPKNHFIRYKLLPLNKEWIIMSSSQKFINYSGLQPGVYTLKVSASNSLNQWSDIKTLTIRVKPPFWKTIYAYILYAIIFGAALYLVIYFILQIQSLKHKIELEYRESETQKRISAAKLTFFANIAHEIKTPVSLISGPIELLRSKWRNYPEEEKNLEIIQRQSKKISQLIDQVHDFQKGEDNLLQMEYSVFNVHNFISEAASNFNFLATSEGKELNIIAPDERIFVSADKDKLEKVLNNLLSNAFKHTKANDKITIEFYKKNKELILKVSDTGSGIHEDDLPFIFDRFYQSQHKHSIYAGGAGIGLAFTKLLVEMHYGYIDAESLLGEGTVLTIRLPVIADESMLKQIKKEEEVLQKEKNYTDSAIINPAQENTFVLDKNFEGITLFLAEDNTELRDFISGFLSKFFKVQSFVNGEDCLIALKKEWPDIIISDVLMPKLNGFDFCRKIKSDVKTSHIPVILLTACISTEEQIAGLNNGADAYITKPFDLQHLLATIETVLKNRKQLREHFELGLPSKLETSSANDEAFMNKLYSLMEKNLDNSDVDLNSFAREVYLNRTHFYQKVKAISNQTPFELLKLYRLKKAAQLLAKNKYSVNEVYMMTGFKSRTHFSKLFKDVYGVTPSKYADSVVKQ